jgi:CBS domain-containing protein
MYGQRVGDVMKRERLLTATPQATVSEAAGLMAGQRVSAVVVVDAGLLVGIFTERDAVFRVIAPGRDPLTTRLHEVMTPAPVTVDPERTFGHALQQMHANGVRHMPVVEDGRPVGIVTARDALDPELEEFVAEARRREAIR